MKPIARLLGVAVAGLALAFAGLPAGGAQQAKPAPVQDQAAKNIDLVICLDVSGSMQGLINSARTRLWDIVNELARIKPSPNFRVGLYSYGASNYDPKAGWVRKELDLTTDLDALYQKLFALKIGGSQEYVARVCRDAVEQQPWSQDKNALKIIFVCGNEHASQDPLVTRKEAADKAIAKGIIINPIYCGNPQSKDAADWIEFAGQSGGAFSSIDQNKGTVAISTPMDKKLAELGEQMAGTYVAYGRLGEEKALNQRVQDGNAKDAGLGVAASRAISKNTALYRCEDWDLVDRCKTDPKFDVNKLPEAELPEVMRKMNPEQRVKYVKDMTDKRLSLQKQVADLTVEREAYVREQMKRNPDPAGQAFDAALRRTLRTQAATKGITIPE